jgi:endonuclease/exonuclease/phosphatase family metal-dependent hydrolase
MAAVTQQQAMMQTENPTTTEHPRNRFRTDLLYYIQGLQIEHHDIVLMGDFNEEYGSDPDGMVHIATICNLQDVLHDRTGSSKFATFIGGRKRIDYVLMSAGPATALCSEDTNPPVIASKATTEASS